MQVQVARLVGIGVTGLCLIAPSAAEPPAVAPVSDRVPIFGSGVELVTLDLVVRDRHGNLVRDLRPGEIEVYEDGVRQQIAEFRPLQRGEAARLAPAAGTPAPAPAPPVAASRRVHLVALVFDQLSVDGRSQARQAARAFVEAQPDTDVYVAVFRIDGRLEMARNFTRNRAELLESLESATLGNAPAFSSNVRAMSGAIGGSENRGDPLQAGFDKGELRPAHYDGDPEAGSPMDGDGPMAAQRGIANATLDILRTAEEVERTQRGNWSLDGMLSVVHGLGAMPGRKTVVYFSEGLQVPPWLDEAFRGLVSEANRAGVSIYAVDVRGLRSAGHLDEAREMLEQAVHVSQSQRLSGGAWHGVTRDQARQFDTVEATLRIDAHGTLDDLARGTGGFLLGDSNDLARGLRKLGEDIRHYYELAYAPGDHRNDGRFHRLTVKVKRAGAQVQSRDGYFAVPHRLGQPVYGYEAPLLAALAQRRPPQQLEQEAALFRFDAEGSRVRHAVVVAVPLASVSFRRDLAAGRHLGRVSVLALVKDASGDVVEKLSQDYLIEGPLADLEATRQRRVSFVRALVLPPGRYSVETAVRDGFAERTGCRRTELRVEAPAPGVRLSSLVAVAGTLPAAAGDEDPFRVGDLSLVPALGPGSDGVHNGGSAALYCVIYGVQGSAEAPRAALEIERSGRTVRSGTVPLPPAAASGRIPQLMTLNLDTLGPGDYTVRLAVTQAGSTATEQTTLRVAAGAEPGRSLAATR